MAMDATAKKQLEEAARAAGFTPVRLTDDGTALLLEGIQQPWNPRDENPYSDCMGDALRLAVKLHLGIEVYGETPNYHTGVTLVETPDYQSDFVEPHNGDPYAATRLAIVRAAAAIDAQRRGT